MTNMSLTMGDKYKTSCIDVSYIIIDIEDNLYKNKSKKQQNKEYEMKNIESEYEIMDIESGLINTNEKKIFYHGY